MSTDAGATWQFNSQEGGQVYGLSIRYARPAAPPVHSTLRFSSSALTCATSTLRGGAPAPAGTDRDAGFELRRTILLDTASSQPETSFYAALARLMTRRDTAGAFTMIDSLCRDRAIGGMFYSYTLIGTYLYARDLPDSLKRKIRDAFRVRTMYRGDTENHWVCYYTGIYLAAQTWPGEDGSRWFNGKSSEENLREAEGWLNHWMEITSTIGQGEFDSPTYSTVFLAPMTRPSNLCGRSGHEAEGGDDAGPAPGRLCPGRAPRPVWRRP